MMQIFDFWLWYEQLPGQGDKIDLGNGKFLEAEDVLEGHFHRIASTTVPVQVSPTLTAAITVLAPGLTPLTELAEQVAHTVPMVQPTPQFRQHLHLALEQTHRQHAAQRVLGTRPPASEGTAWSMITLLLVLAIGLLAAIVYLRKRQQVKA